MKEGSSSFLKKRTKKLALVGIRGQLRIGPRAPVSKSFLVLFFKKELLLLLAFPAQAEPLHCGVIAQKDDWNKADQHGDLSAFETQICRAVGTNFDGGASVARFGEEAAALAALRKRDVDLVVGATPSATAQATSNVRFGAVVFYDAIAVMARAGGIAGRLVCAAEGSDAEALLDVARAKRRDSGAMFPFQEEGEMESAFIGGRCSGLAATMSRLGQIRATYGGRLGPVTILPERFGLLPAALAYRPQDIRLGAVADWSVYALLQAEAVGMTQRNASVRSDAVDLETQRLAGVQGGAGRALGLPARWAVSMVAQVGNYGEIFNRTVGSGSPMALPRGENALWSNGGLMVPPPVQ